MSALLRMVGLNVVLAAALLGGTGPAGSMKPHHERLPLDLAPQEGVDAPILVAAGSGRTASRHPGQGICPDEDVPRSLQGCWRPGAEIPSTGSVRWITASDAEEAQFPTVRRALPTGVALR